LSKAKNGVVFACSTNDEADDSDLTTNIFQEGGDDGRRPKQGSITRSMARHIKLKMSQRHQCRSRYWQPRAFVNICKIVKNNLEEIFFVK